MNVYSVDIDVVATAYIVAESEEEARKIIQTELTGTGTELLEESPGGFVRGARFETLIEEIEDDIHLPRATISPAVTLIGPSPNCRLEVVE